MAVTQHIKNTYETPTYATGNLDTQDGYAKVGTGGNTMFVIATALLGGAQAVAFRHAGPTGAIAYEKSVTARGASERWRIIWKVHIKSTATNNRFSNLGLTKGAVNLTTFATDALDVGFRIDTGTGKVDVLISDNAFPPSGAPDVKADQFDDDTTVRMRVDIFGDNTYALFLDSNNDGEGWTQIASGTLVSGNEAIDRFNWGHEGTTDTDDTHLYDDLTIVKITDDTAISLGERQRRVAVVSSTPAISGENVEFNVDIRDELTGDTVAANRLVTVPLTVFDNAPGESNELRLASFLEEELRRYDREQRISSMSNVTVTI